MVAWVEKMKIVLREYRTAADQPNVFASSNDLSMLEPRT